MAQLGTLHPAGGQHDGHANKVNNVVQQQPPALLLIVEHSKWPEDTS
jgi:hypothetical protein